MNRITEVNLSLFHADFKPTLILLYHPLSFTPAKGVHLEAGSRPQSITIALVLIWIGAAIGTVSGIVLITERNNAQVQVEMDLSARGVALVGTLVLVLALTSALLAIGISRGNAVARFGLAVILFGEIAVGVVALLGFTGLTRLQALVNGAVALIVLYFLFDTQESRAYFA